MHVNSSQDPNSPMSLPERESFNLGQPEVSLSAGPGSELIMELQNLCTAMTPATYLQVFAVVLLLCLDGWPWLPFLSAETNLIVRPTCLNAAHRSDALVPGISAAPSAGKPPRHGQR